MKITGRLSTMFLCYTFTMQPASSSCCRSAPAMGTHWQYILYKIKSILGIFSDLFQHFPDFKFCYGNFTPSWFSHLKAREIIWIGIKHEWTETGLPYKKPMKVVMKFFTEAIISIVLKILCIHWCDTGHISLSIILEFYCRQFCIRVHCLDRHSIFDLGFTIRVWSFLRSREISSALSIGTLPTYLT